MQVLEFFMDRPVYLVPAFLLFIYVILDMAGRWEEWRERRRIRELERGE